MILTTDEALLILGAILERQGGAAELTLDEVLAVGGKYLGRAASDDGQISVYIADGPREH